MSNEPIKMAVPKGSLQKATSRFFSNSGLELEGYDEKSRNYRPTINIPNVEIKVLRPQEIPILISRGYYDIGISGVDWYRESRCERNVRELVDLRFGKVDIVLAVPDAWDDVNTVDNLFQKFSFHGGTLRIWTEYLNLTEDFVGKYLDMEPTIISPYQMLSRRRHSSVIIFHSFGATESKPPDDGEAIVDNTETGNTLRANGLKIIHKVLAGSTARLLANNQSIIDERKSEQINTIMQACEKGAKKMFPDAPIFNGHIPWENQ